ncbi:MAG TPA: autotransporter-associated beta strand repeat-containing protein [Verrucomicrobiae bacterium]|nr:autotransporter-associated beta strand repeat-containing protein [Verrucomicrobiae bacterium]
MRYSGTSGATATFSTTVGANGGTLDYSSAAFSYIFYNGTLTGSGTLNILDSSNTGNQWLFTSASSSFTGPINIGDGTADSGWLQVRGVTSANQVGTGTITINGGGTFSYDTGSAATIANPIVLNGGALGAQSVGITYSGPIVITNNSFIGGVQTSVGTTMTLSGVISGPGGFTTAGNNGTTTIVLGNANTFSGGATLSSGTLSLNNSLALQNSTLYDLTNFHLVFGAPTAYTLGGLSGTGSIMLTNGAGSGVALTVGNNNATTAYSGILSGSGSLTKTGSGVLTLSGASTYTGNTIVSGGTLKDGVANALPTGTTLIIQGAGSTFDLNGSAQTVAGLSDGGGAGGFLTNGAAAATFTVNNTASSTFSGVIGGAVALTKSGSGTLTLSGTAANAYSGLTTVSAGELDLDKSAGVNAIGGNLTISGGLVKLINANQINNSAALTINSGTFDLNDNSEAVDALSGTGGTILDSGNNTGTLTFGSNNGGGTYSGTIADGNGAVALIKTGTGTGTLSGNNSYSGGTTINGGTIVAASSTALGAGDLTMAGGVLQLGANLAVGDLSGNSGTIGIFVSNTSETLTVGSDNSNTTFSAAINQGGNANTHLLLVKTGTGVLTMTSAETFNGGTTINGGAINIQNAAALGTGSITVNNGGALQLQGGISEGLALTLNGTGVANDGALRNVSGNNTYSGNMTFGSATRINSDSGTLTISSSITGGNFGLTIGGAGITLFSAAIPSSVGSLTKDGTGTLILANTADAYAGDTTISAGVLKLGASNVLPNGTGNVNVNGGTLDMAGFSDTINGLNGGGTVDNSTGTGNTLTVGNNNANSTFSGVIQNTSGSLAITKTGTGTLTLSGTAANTYSGLTTVSGGELDLNKTAGVNAIGGNLTIAGGEVKLLSSEQLANTAVVTINTGSFNLNGQSETPANMIVGPTGLLTNGIAGGTLNSGLTNAGTVYVSQATYLKGPVTNTGAVFFQGAISNSLVNSGSFNLNNNATLTVAPANSGTINVAASTLTVNPAWANSATVQLGGGVLTGGNLTNNSSGNVAGFGTISNQLVNAGMVTATNGNLLLVGAANGSGVYRAVAGTSAATLTFVNGGSINSLFDTNATIVVQGPLTNSSVFVNAGTLMVAGGTYQTGANVTNAAGATIANSGAGSLNAGAVFNLGTILATNATFTISNLVAQGGTVTIGAGGTLTLPGASSLTNFGTINLQGAAGNNAVLNLGGAVLTNQSGGTITGGGVIQNAGQVVNLLGGSILATSTVVELQFTNANTFGNAGTIGATAGATLTFGSAGVGSAIITNSGTINLARGTLRSGNITNLASGFLGGTGVVTAVVINQGRMNFSGTISNGLQNSGSFTLNDDTTVTSNIMVNAGGVLDLVGNNLTNKTDLVINSGGVLTNGGAANAGATVIGGVTNGGTIFVTGNTFFDGAVTNTGGFFFQGTVSNNLVNSANGTITLNNTATITQTASINSGTLNLNGQTMNNGLLLVSGSGVLTNGVAGATVNGGVSNANVIAVTANTFFKGPVTNTGAFYFEGAISNNLVNSGSLDLNGAATITGAAVNNGTFNVDGQTLTVIPTWANSGTILLAGGTVAGGTLTNASGAVMNGAGNVSAFLVNNGLVVVTNGTMTLSTGLQQNGLINVADGTAPGTLSVTPAWANNGTLSVAAGGAVNGGNLTNLASATVTNFGSINTLLVNQGRVVLGGLVSNFQQTSGTNIVSGRGTVTGTATVTGGLFDLNGGIYSNGLMILGGSGVLTSSAANATFNGGLSNGGTAYFAQNVYFNGTVTNTGAFLWEGAISNNFVNAGNGTVTLNNSATVTRTATINGGVFNLNGQAYSNGLMVLGGAGVLTNAIAGATFSGGLSNDATVAVTANTFFNGPVTNTGAVFFQGAVSNSFVNTANGTLTINNTTTITGLLANQSGNQVNVNNGTLQLAVAPTQNGTLTIASTGVLNIPTAWNNGGTIVINGGTINSGNLTNLAGAALTGFATLSNAVINSAGALITANGGTLTLVNGLTQNGGVLVNPGATLQVNPDWVSTGTITVNGTLMGGTLTNASNTGTLSGSGTIDSFVVNQGRVNWGGTINNNFLQTAGSFTLSGGATITGSASINGGTLDLAGNRLTDSSLLIGTGATLTNSIQNATLNGSISNAGTVNLFRDTYVNAAVTNTGTWIQRGAISNNVVNSGVMAFYTNSINVRITGSIVNSGSLTFDTNGTVYVSGAVSNSGSFAFSDVISNNLVNTAGGSITLNGAGTVTGNTLVNGGTLDLNGKSLTSGSMIISGTGVLTNNVTGATVNGGLSNDATVAVTANTYFKGPVTNTGNFFFEGAISNTFVTSDTAKLLGAGTITGTASITGGTFDLNGKSLASSQLIVTSAGVLTNSTAGASMSGAVTLQNSTLAGQSVNNNAVLGGSGTISAPLNNTASGVITANSGLLTITGALTQNGTINVASGGTLNVPQAFANGGSLNMQGGLLEGGTVTVTSGDNISGFGTISNAIINQGLITATGGTLTLAGSALATQAGSGINVASGGTLSVASDWADSGTLTVSGTLIGGTITNISSTGTLSGSGTITAFVVNQGRVNWGGTMNNYLQTAGSLTLSANATITGNATISGGGFDLVNNVLTAGLLTINNGATMQNSGGVGTITGNVVNNGTVNFNLNDLLDDSSVAINGQVVNNGTWTQAGTINGTLVNTGSFDWTSHTYFFGFGTEASPLLNGGVTNTGSLTFDPSYVAHVTGSVTNSGAINFNGTIGGNLWQTAGNFTLNGAGTISGPAMVNGGSFNLNGQTYNGGTMVIGGTGVLTNAVAGANFNSGLSNAANVGVTANTFFKGAVTNTGTFAFMGAVSNTLVNSGDVILNGSGTISGALVNDGSVNVNSGTLSLVVAPTQNGSITVNNGATLNAAQAWANNGTVTVLGGTVTNGTITSTGFISGYGTIDGGGVVNNGKVFANAGSISGNGTLTVRLASFTNNNAATIGTASSNAVLNILQAGNILINQGTVSLSGGTIDFNGGSGTITNYNIIAGVGNVASFPIVNAGTLASFVAQAPISGLSNLIATVGVTNNGLLGANNLINGAATLSLTVGGGGSAIVNQGTVALQGGFLTVNGGAGTITNNSLVYGVGTQNLSVANMAPGRIMASNGVFSLSLQSNANAGVLSNLNAVSTIALNNNFLKNTGTVVLNGGGLLMNGVITNESNITGPGAISSSLYNDTPGAVLITNGVLNLATNTGDFVENLGLFTITSDGTLNVLPAWVNTNGTVNIVGGGLTGGAVTNVGLVSGFGTISSQLVNMGSGTVTASGAGALTLVAAPTQNGWVNIASAGTLNVLQSWLNSGIVDVQGGNLGGSTVTNAGTIFGSGTINTQVRNTGSGTLTASGGTLTLTVAPSQLGSVIISNAATLNVLQAWQNGGTLNLFGGTAIGSTIANASTISGFGTITPLVQNTGGGTVTATGGTLTLVAAPSQLGTFVVANGGTLNVRQAWQNGGVLSMAGGTAIGSTITNAANVSGFGTITSQLINNSGATVTATGGTLTLAAAPVQLGNLVVSNTGTLNVLQAWQNSGNMRMRGGTVIGSGITNGGSLEGFGTINPQVVNNSGATLTADSGLLTLALALIQNGNVIVTNGGTLNVLAAWQNNGTIAMKGGNISGSTLTNAGTMTGFGGVQNLVNNSLILVTNGTLQATASFGQNGTVNIAATSQLNVTPSWLNSGTILLNGGFTGGGTMTNASTGVLTGFGTISNAVANAGSLVATNGTLTLVNALTQSGTITVDNGATFNSIAAWQNGGFLSVLGGSVVGGALTNSGSITGFGTFSPSVLNNNGATITASGGGTLNLTAIPFQNGLVNILGTLNVASAWSNGSAGTVSINGGVLKGGTFTVDGTVGGNGTIAANMIVNNGKSVTVGGGTLNVMALTTMNGGAINSGALVNYGTLSGYGTIGSTLSNPGYVRATNGLLYVQALSGNQATGTLEASAGGTLQANGVTSWINNGQVILSGGTVIGGDISNSFSHGISGFGTITPNVYNSGQLMANNAGQPLTLNGSLVNLSSGTVAANNGNLVVNGAFVNSGTLAMTHSVGTFASAVINSGAWITDPTTNVFQDTYTLASSGYIQAGGGDVYVFTNNGSHVANFVNQSTQSNAFNTVSAKFVFNASLTLTQTLYAAGRNIGNLSISGGFDPVLVGIAATNALVEFESNFALGTLEIDSTTEVAGAQVDGGFDPGGQNALFINELDLDPGAHLIISNDVQIYFISSNAFTSSQVTLLGNAGLHLLTSDASLVVPEPSVVLLWLSSIATIYAARRRAAGKK